MPNKHWRKSQLKDPFLVSAHQEHYRSRSYFKLQQINKSQKIIRKGMNCIDLGSYPGGWSLYSRKNLAKKDNIFAIDLKKMDKISGVTFIQGDFSDPDVQKALSIHINNLPIALVMSDIAPNITGNELVDQCRSMDLAKTCLEFSANTLESGGTFLVKLFQGDGFEDYIDHVREFFGKIKIIKPEASRKESREVFLLAKNFNYFDN